MQAILKFNLPEDQEEFDVACKASDLYLSLWDIDQELRNAVKYNNASESADRLKVYDNIRDLIRKTMAEHSCDLEMMS